METIYNQLNQALKRFSEVPNVVDVIDFIQRIGFQIIQERITHRLITHVVNESNSESEILAELAPESVVYNINPKNVWHYDIEIEEKSASGSRAHKTISQALMSSDYGRALKNWKYGKLALGKGLENLIKTGRLQEYEFDNLTLETYNKIEKMIESGSI